MKPQTPPQPQPSVQPQAHMSAPIQPQAQQAAPQRMRPAAPEGARAPAAGMKDVARMPVTAPMFEVPESAPMTVASRPSAPAPGHMPARAPDHTPVEAVYPRAQERRRSPRQTLVAKAVVRSEFNQNTLATGFLSNISMLGVGFHTRRPLTVGEKFHMRLELGPMKWATRLRVVSCQPHDTGTYDVGAEFIGNDLTDHVRRDLAA